ncbi:hypothetical protein N7491_002650 [Penicillium cf. griseofulvum]|nr:hypothetical protein N7491_002650 [Penicillium cf. griseofulvum]
MSDDQATPGTPQNMGLAAALQASLIAPSRQTAASSSICVYTHGGGWLAGTTSRRSHGCNLAFASEATI